MSQPFFSICISLDHIKLSLRETLQSIFQQRYSNFEIILQSNISEDLKNSVLAEFGDERISFAVNSHPLDTFSGFNQACKRAQGRYLKFLSPKDVLAKDCLKQLYNVLKEQDFKTKLVSIRTSENREILSRYYHTSDLRLFLFRSK